jgi:hypothetical protein
MKKVIPITTVVILSFFTLAQKKMDSLLVWGEGFSFGVTEPAGWTGHTEDAYRYRLNIYFCLGRKKIDNSPAIMHITVLDKGNRSIQEHLEYDMENYKKNYQNIEFQDFSIEGLKYEALAKIFIIEDKTVDYVCFLDPGKGSQLYVVFVLHGPGDTTPHYQEDFVKLVKSFAWLS